MKALLAAALVAASTATPAAAQELTDAEMRQIDEFLRSLDTPHGSRADRAAKAKSVNDQVIDPRPTLDNPTAKLERMTLRCELWIQNYELETSPVTYQRIDVEKLGPNIRGEPLIGITYDAQNIYGAIVRKKEVCRFDEAGRLVED